MQGPTEILAVGGYWKIGDEAQVANFVVRPENRRAGFGEQLLRYLLTQARQEGCQLATLEVRAQNKPAQALYRKAGFVQTGRRPRVYSQPMDDALLMEKQL